MAHKDHSKVLLRVTLATTLTCVPALQPVQAQLAEADKDKVQSILQRMALRYKNMEQSQKQDASKVLVKSDQRPSKQPETDRVSAEQTSELKAVSDGVQQHNSPSPSSFSQVFPTSDPSQPMDEPNTDNILTSNDSRFALGEELILGLQIGDYQLADLYAIKAEPKALVGFNALSEVLQLPIKVANDFSSAEGWVFNERNKFLLERDDSGKFIVTVHGKKTRIPAEKIQLLQDDIYIDIDLIGSWLYFSSEIDETNLKLLLKSERQLPIEARLARQNKKATQSSKPQYSVLPERDSGYSVFSPPLFDASVSTNFSKGEQSGSYSVLGSQDLMYLNANYFVSGADTDAVNNARLTFSRQAPDNDLLGFLGGTEIELGDVEPVRQGLGISQGLSRGLRLSNTPLKSLQNNKLINVNGDVQNGWDVELYRDGILIGNKLSVSDGRYEFNDIELVYGDNNFELVFYGPEGQIETKQEVYTIDENAVKQGEARYQLSVVDINKSMFGLENTATEPNQAGYLSSGVFTYGVADWLSFDSGLSSFEPDAGEKSMNYSLGSSLAIPDIAILNYTTEMDDKDNRGQQYNLRTQLLGQSVSLTRSVFDEQSQTSVELTRTVERSRAALNGSFFQGSALPVSYNASWSQNKRVDAVFDSFDNSLGIKTPIGYFSHSIARVTRDRFSDTSQPVVGVFNDQGFEVVDSSDPFDSDFGGTMPVLLSSEEDVTGSLQYRTNIGRVFTRFSASYSIKPEKQITGVSASVSAPISQDISSNGTLSYSPLSERIAANLSLNWRRESVLFSGRANFDNKGSWSVGLSARLGFGYAPENMGLFSEGKNIAGTGLVVARVYEDKNINGKFDEGEKLVEGAKVVAQQNSKQAKTNADGIAVLSGMYNFIKTDVVVDRSSFDEPYKMSTNAGVAVTPRRGKMNVIEYPVVATTELEGNVYVKTESGINEPIAYALLELVDSSGKVVTDTQSEFDGYYLFVDLIPGNYKIRIEPDYAKRKEYRASTPLYLKAKGGEIINGKDLLLEQTELVPGYASELGQFTNLNILKAYWLMLSRSGMNTAKLKPFYMQNSSDKKFTLYSSFLQVYEDVERNCSRFNARKVSCQVKEIEFKL